jgi:hypothetical protein
MSPEWKKKKKKKKYKDLNLKNLIILGFALAKNNHK